MARRLPHADDLVSGVLDYGGLGISPGSFKRFRPLQYARLRNRRRHRNGKTYMVMIEAPISVAGRSPFPSS